MNLEVTDWLSLPRGKAVVTFRIENVLHEEVHHPEFNRRKINSLPAEGDLALYAGMRFEF